MRRSTCSDPGLPHHTLAHQSPLGLLPQELTNIGLLPVPPSSHPLVPHFPTSQILPYCPLEPGLRKSHRVWWKVPLDPSFP